MMNRFDTWAQRWAVTPAALEELKQAMGITSLRTVADEVFSDASESRQQSLIRLGLAQQGVTLFRNNVGALRNEDGRMVRYGLANDSAAFNKLVKSSDLIGWREITITPELIGQKVAQFVSVECKRADWQWSGDDRELAQLRWIEEVTKVGGYARFANAPFVV